MRFWLDHADVSDLLAPQARARAGSKLVLKPVVWLLGATGLWYFDQGFGGPPQTLALREIAMVQAAAQRPTHGRAHVRRGHCDGQAERPAGFPAAVGPEARSVRYRHGPLWLSAVGPDLRSADYS